MPLLSPDEIRIRDPFVLPDAAGQDYYLYGTTDPEPWHEQRATGFDAYRSRDLLRWEGPFPVFRPAPGFWGTHHFWAPEVHRWQGRYFMFASFKGSGRHRGTQVLVADHPLGPFQPHSPLAVTPADCECLDGTLYVAPEGTPWMIFSRDWTQTTVGAYAARPLTPDLSAAAGPAIELFPVSDAPWVIAPPWQAERTAQGLPPCYVADGAFPFRSPAGVLCLLFSSWGGRRLRHRPHPLAQRRPARPLAAGPRADLCRQRRPRHGVHRLRRRGAADPAPAQRSRPRAPALFPLSPRPAHDRVTRPGRAALDAGAPFRVCWRLP